ncbi:MAG: GNAT family N-acetyltransferase [Candidatus Micrarchaeota archaeon]|nr:GNAT family N-acetyltransferase [Candidatus Micrarchaeota archaeon]
MALTIRKGGEMDFPEILGLIRELAAFSKAPPDTVRNSVDRMKQDSGLFRSFVAESDGKIVGFALYFFSYSTWVGRSIYIEDLYIKPDFRRRRVGSMLIKAVFEVAEKEHCNRVRLQVLNWNENAISFYKKHGGVIHDEWLTCDFEEPAIKQFLEHGAE